MKISDWLDEKVAEKVDVSQIDLPADIAFDSDPDEIVFFKEENPCGSFCTGIVSPEVIASTPGDSSIVISQLSNMNGIF
jgi:hypothetical protein